MSILLYLENKIVSKIAHTKYTINLDRFGAMMDSEDKKLALKRCKWMPDRIQDAAYNNLIEQFSIIISKNEISKLIKDQMLQVKMFNKINSLLPSLYWCLYLKPEKKHLDFFMDYFGKECKGASDLQLIQDDIRRLTSKYKELFYKPEQDEKPIKKEKFDFVRLVMGIETILDRQLDRKLKLFELERYYQLAVEQQRKQEHG